MRYILRSPVRLKFFDLLCAEIAAKSGKIRLLERKIARKRGLRRRKAGSES